MRQGHHFRFSQSISNVTNQVTESTGILTETSEEMQGIVNLIERIVEISREHAAHTNTVTGSTEQQIAALQEVSGAAMELTTISEQLQEKISTLL